ncbi:MAG: gamma-glutamyl-gamma-aminobutyrate hydrolase family protein [Deltaproteobacteria bacterium]|nr:gamma-glutamyl-gamma-aminobutyrate hydrolase family protein [Deltaproteobacteria bacterium]
MPVPVLGLCFGHQLLAHLLGGKVVAAGSAREYGLAEIRCAPGAGLFEGLDPVQRVWMSHGDHVEQVPPGFRATASSERLAVAAMESEDGSLWGVQFHPEVTHTEQGNQMLRRFLTRCGAGLDWSAEGQVERIVGHIRDRAAGRSLFLLVSGGVDSLVCLALCLRAVGPQRIHSLHVDTGFMRQAESSEIVAALAALGFENLHVAQAEARFLETCRGVVDPEAKRALIGRLFVDVLHDEVGRLPLGDDWMLVQGTIYPDTIESGGTQKAARIKTHHNRVEEIARMIEAGKVIEPLSELYKDEVRALGRQLGLPDGLVQRHPFPGPGLAIRVLVSADGTPPPGFERDAGKIAQLASTWGLGSSVLPVRTVGVQGDERTYRHAAVVWSQGEAGGHGPGWPTLKRCAASVVNQVSSINRVLLSLEPLPPGSLRLGRCMLEKPQLDLLRRVDKLVRDRTAAYQAIWQIPVVALPLFDLEGRQAFVVRPVCSQDAMTAEVFEMDVEAWCALVQEARKIAGVGPLLYELTTKPPATIEWE